MEFAGKIYEQQQKIQNFTNIVLVLPALFYSDRRADKKAQN
jgi:hypothetical protein